MLSSLKKRLVIASAVIFGLGGVAFFITPALAVDFNGCEVYDTEGNCLDDFYIANDISYDPSVPVCTADGTPLGEAVEEGEEPVVEIGAEADYSGRPILGGGQIAAITEHQSIYEQAADEQEIPWQILAVLHLKGSGLTLENPENGLGLYQIPFSEIDSYPEGPVEDDEFLEQTKQAAEYIKGANSTLTNDISKVDDVKLAFFRYLTPVGSAALYTNQASELGFDNAYDGSPEVMNRVDAERDPARAEANTWGQYDEEDEALVYPAGQEYGAYPIFATISGISLAGCGLTEGGMDLDQARAFMEIYKQIDNGDPNGDSQYLAGFWHCTAGYLTDNCVTFSGYFVNKYTDLRPANVNGRIVVNTMNAYNPGTQVAREPRPFAVFSTASGVTLCADGQACGHTGIVLGVNKEEDTIIIGEAAWCRPGFTGAHVYQLSRWNGTGYTYLYTDDHLKEDVLARDIR
jgi:hypothetical protein